MAFSAGKHALAAARMHPNDAPGLKGSPCSGAGPGTPSGFTRRAGDRCAGRFQTARPFPHSGHHRRHEALGETVGTGLIGDGGAGWLTGLARQLHLR